MARARKATTDGGMTVTLVAQAVDESLKCADLEQFYADRQKDKEVKI